MGDDVGVIEGSAKALLLPLASLNSTELPLPVPPILPSQTT
jgi:hypothetical protein